VGIADRLRPMSKRSIEMAKSAGIQVTLAREEEGNSGSLWRKRF
jgi:hypothetical protein